MALTVGPLDESANPSPYRGVTKISTPTPANQKYMLYDASGLWMGEVKIRADLANPKTEALIRQLQELNDPDEEEVDPKAHLRLA